MFAKNAHRPLARATFATTGALFALALAACAGGATPEGGGADDAGLAPEDAGAKNEPADASFDPDAAEPAQPRPAAANATSPAANASAVASACPDGMVLVAGSYCPKVREHCTRWLDDPSLSYARCAEYAETECVAPREQRRFCIDRDEHVAEGETLPQVDVSWTTARETCQAEGKRLCRETEWQLACEGEELRPYPYGWRRDDTACNFDQKSLYNPDFSLRDLREPPGARAACVSPYGVRDMVGNVDEWTVRDGETWGPYRSSLKGGWWLAGRNRCRAATTAHDEHYHGPQAGFRCCDDAKAD